MAIDTAEKRRSVSGVPFFLIGPGVTPEVLKDGEWRQEVCYSYSGIAVAAPPAPAPPPAVVAADAITPWRPWRPWGPWKPYPVRYEGEATLSALALLQGIGVVITYQNGQAVLTSFGELSGRAKVVALAKGDLTGRGLLKLEHMDNAFELEMLGLP